MRAAARPPPGLRDHAEAQELSAKRRPPAALRRKSLSVCNLPGRRLQGYETAMALFHTPWLRTKVLGVISSLRAAHHPAVVPEPPGVVRRRNWLMNCSQVSSRLLDEVGQLLAWLAEVVVQWCITQPSTGAPCLPHHHQRCVAMRCGFLH
jgi:hypothetical protein